MIAIDTTLIAITDELAAEDARAVILFGSFARGDAADHSDIDLLALGEGRARYELRGRRLLVANWATLEDARAGLSDPGRVGEVIPGWREARVLYDPDGIAAALQAAARVWTWDRVEPGACDALVASRIAGYAEEAFKLANALAADRQLMAAVQRDAIALSMAGIMALHRRLLYGTENRLWDLVAATLGDPWATVQARAFGLGGESFVETCRAALRLYALAASEARDLLDDTQRAIVDHACGVGYDSRT